MMANCSFHEISLTAILVRVGNLPFVSKGLILEYDHCVAQERPKLTSLPC